MKRINLFRVVVVGVFLLLIAPPSIFIGCKSEARVTVEESTLLKSPFNNNNIIIIKNCNHIPSNPGIALDADRQFGYSMESDTLYNASPFVILSVEALPDIRSDLDWIEGVRIFCYDKNGDLESFSCYL